MKIVKRVGVFNCTLYNKYTYNFKNERALYAWVGSTISDYKLNKKLINKRRGVKLEVYGSLGRANLYFYNDKKWL